VRAGVIVTGVLGAGSVLVFALAVAASALFPNGGSIMGNVNQVFMNGVAPMAAPAVGIAVPAPVQSVLVAPVSDPNSPSPAASPSGSVVASPSGSMVASPSG
jgi:hypothetical protein